jgi:hypothetical protein
MNREDMIKALETEADRIKERLDNLDDQIQGRADAWLEIQLRMPPTVAEVLVDKLLSEARQQALALTTITKALDALAGEGEKRQESNPEDELVARRKEREAERAKLAAQA